MRLPSTGSSTAVLSLNRTFIYPHQRFVFAFLWAVAEDLHVNSVPRNLVYQCWKSTPSRAPTVAGELEGLFEGLAQMYSPMAKGSSKKSCNAAVLLFDAVELLDVTSAFQVLHAARDNAKDRRTLNVFAVAEQQRTLLTEAGLTVIPRYSFDSVPRVDILIVPGGIGARTAAFNEGLMMWVKETAAQAALVVGLSTGALLLGKAGLLSGLEATTHAQSASLLQQVAKTVIVKPEERYVDAGKVVTGAGGMASMDTCLYVVGRVLGADYAKQAALNLNYNQWNPTWEGDLSP